jgi:hypothetical protein
VSYTYLQEQGAESSAESFSGIPVSVLSRLNLTAAKCCSNGNETDASRSSQSGMTCGHSTGDRGEGSLMSSVEGSLVRTLAVPEAAAESREREADCGQSLLVSLARYDRASHSLKTRQTLLFEGSTESLLILPRWGWMRSGECFLLAPLVPHTCDSGCSYWPTPRADGRDNCGGSNARKKAQANGTYIGRYPNPVLQERLMAWPESWTDLKPLATDKFRQWLDSHGKRS